MYEVGANPLFWLAEFAVCLLVLGVILLSAGAGTLFIARLPTSHASKHVLVILLHAALAILSTYVFDQRTHLYGALAAALGITFTTPLQAVAYLHRYRTPKAIKCPSSISTRSALLRIAVPGCPPSLRHPSESPYLQFMRALGFIALGGVCAPFLAHALRRGGLVLDALALITLSCGANGALNLTSAILGFCGEPCARPFRNPFFSKSLAHFWAGKWNAPVSSSLRYGVYEPLVCAGFPPLFSVMACFVVSGLAHELILLFVGASGSKGQWMLFFVLCGFATILEKALDPVLGRNVVLRWALTMTVLYFLFHFYFVPVTVRTGLAHRGVDTLSSGTVFCTVLLKRFLASVS